MELETIFYLAEHFTTTQNVFSLRKNPDDALSNSDILFNPTIGSNLACIRSNFRCVGNNINIVRFTKTAT